MKKIWQKYAKIKFTWLINKFNRKIHNNKVPFHMHKIRKNKLHQELVRIWGNGGSHVLCGDV